MDAAATIYEPQLRIPGARTCGAAALCMVYRSQGIECRQEDVWARLMGRSRATGGARAHRLAADARQHGVAALVVQVQSPWEFLTACSQASGGVILNHRVNEQSAWGHYTVLVQIDAEAVWVHDPQLGPHQRVARDELLRIWQGCPGRTEIAGQVAIVISQVDEPTPCPFCLQAIPSQIECPNCNQEIALQPGVAIGCWNGACEGHRWRRVFCPRCDWGCTESHKHTSIRCAGCA